MLGQDVVSAAGDRAVGLTHADLDVTDAAAVCGRARGATVINCAAYTDVDGAETDPDAAQASTPTGARNVAEAAARVIYVSTDYVFDGAKPGRTSSRTRPPAPEYGALQAGRRARHPRRTRTPDRAHRRGCSAPAAATSSTRCCALGEERERAEGRGRPGRLARRSRATSPKRSSRWRRATSTASCTWRAPARAPGSSSRARSSSARASTSTLRPCATEEFPRPARRPANSVLASERGAPEAARLAGRPGRLSGGARVKLLVTGGAGFIGSTYVRLFTRRPRDRGARQADLRGPARERAGRTWSSSWAGSRTASSSGRSPTAWTRS